MCDGKPVPYVTVYLQPKQVSEKKALVGKQGIGYADSQGNFVVTTYDTNDGAVVGKQNILVGPPLGEVPSDFKCDCVLSESEVVMEVEVVSGKANSFEVQLKKANNFEKKQQEKVIATQRAEQED